ncbi:pleckstrin-2 isoform X2 [Hypomesus transpacificus]|uniref:pleckstrin-2 isoform X2 n=1 Tax=Hypomesus transpacificus TaxID=137520 RepID=UPI001F0720C0|nr:pleckstrin-2 isoform X2 [Hypomesus transpacificus]
MDTDQNSSVLKEGFLVKRGHVVHNWKARWFVLMPDKLLYYKYEGGKRESCQRGRIMLKECVVTCPFLEYDYRPLVIRLQTQSCGEHFLEACSREERDEWAAGITAAMASLHYSDATPDNQSEAAAPKSLGLHNINLSQVLDSMYDIHSGIRMSNLTEQGSTYSNCFSGWSDLCFLITYSNCFSGWSDLCFLITYSNCFAGWSDLCFLITYSNCFSGWSDLCFLITYSNCFSGWSDLCFLITYSNCFSGWSDLCFLITYSNCFSGWSDLCLLNIYSNCFSGWSDLCFLITYSNCFSGSSVVDWLVFMQLVLTRVEAATLASALLEEGFLRPLGFRSVEALRSAGLSQQFLDDSTALYGFSDSFKKRGSVKPEKTLSAVELAGKVVKRGFLLKQGHKRKNWKVRLFVLRSQPGYLHYYDPSKDDINPAGGFSLRGCLVSALDDNGVPSGVKGNVQGNLFKIITQSNEHYFIQAPTRQEKIDWVEAVRGHS